MPVCYFTSVRIHILGLKLLINICALWIDGAMLIFAVMHYCNRSVLPVGQSTALDTKTHPLSTKQELKRGRQDKEDVTNFEIALEKVKIKPDPDEINLDIPWDSEVKDEHGLNQNTFLTDNFQGDPSNFSLLENDGIDSTKFLGEVETPNDNWELSRTAQSSSNEDEDDEDWKMPKISKRTKRKPKTRAPNVVKNECDRCGFTTENRFADTIMILIV